MLGMESEEFIFSVCV